MFAETAVDLRYIYSIGMHYATDVHTTWPCRVSGKSVHSQVFNCMTIVLIHATTVYVIHPRHSHALYFT